LSVVASHVGGRYRGHDLRRGRALFQQPQALGTKKGIDQRLRRDRTDARFDARNERAHSEETTRNCNSQLSGPLIASDDRPGHAPHPQVRRSNNFKLGVLFSDAYNPRPLGSNVSLSHLASSVTLAGKVRPLDVTSLRRAMRAA